MFQESGSVCFRLGDCFPKKKQRFIISQLKIYLHMYTFFLQDVPEHITIFCTFLFPFSVQRVHETHQSYHTPRRGVGALDQTLKGNVFRILTKHTKKYGCVE